MEFENFMALMLGALMCALFILDIYVLQIRDILIRRFKNEKDN